MSFLKKTGKALADIIPGLGRMTVDASMTDTVFVTSGSGVIGYRVAMSLLQAGHRSVRVGIWMGDPSKPGGKDKSFDGRIMSVLQAKGAEVVSFDWADESCYEGAINGAKTVFCTIPHMDDWVSVFPSFLKACKDMEVVRFVKISFLRNSAAAERYREHVPFVQFHSTCDDLLIKTCETSSSMTYTILCTSHLMSTPLLHQGSLLRKQHKFVTASYGMGVNYVSPNDVADASVVVILNQKEHTNKIYNLTGAGPVFDKDVAVLLSKAYGTEIQHVSLGYHDYKNDIKARGLPNWLVKDSAAFEKMKASGIDEYASSYTEDLEKLIGKKPETFADYLENKNAQRPGLTFP
jgi:nucleoside-diphosphate-sugar epimerase